jgi:hypothetical protein
MSRRSELGNYAKVLVTKEIIKPRTKKMIYGSRLNGDVIADLPSEQTATVNDKIVTPEALAEMLQKPFPIGEKTPNTGKFTTLSATTLTADNISFDAIAAESLAIGESLAINASGNLNTSGNVNAANINASNSITISESLTINSSGHINTSGSIDASSLAINTDSLTIDSSGNINTSGNVTANGLILTNSLDEVYGGTGHSSYTNGDILVGDSEVGLNILPIGTNGQVLTVTGGAPTWTTQSAGASGFPAGYVNLSNPRPNVNGSSTIYDIQYCYCRDQTDTVDIEIPYNVTIYPFGGVNGFAQSTQLGSDATSLGLTVSGSAIESHFQVGDAIFIGGQGRRVTALGVDSITVEAAFSPDISSASGYFRGGFAPNTTYYLYAVKGTSGTCYSLSTRCTNNDDYPDTLVDLPSGYDQYYRMLWPVFITLANPNPSFANFTYHDNRMISYFDLTDPTKASLNNINGFSYATTSTSTTLIGSTSLLLPKTMGTCYLQATSNGSITTNYKFKDGTLDVYYPNQTRVASSDGNPARFTFLGGYINKLNIVNGPI